MLEKLLIQNFQAHSRLCINFDKGVTTIVGPSDVGKSAILRALRWVCLNTPGGDAFVRTGTKGAVVRLVIDGHTIERRRGGDVNTYRLDDDEYKAFGRNVPDPIAELLNTGDVCWQGQHDPPFWFAETAGEVSRQLNSIVNLGIIDKTLANVATAHHRARTRLEMSEERLTAANKAKADLKWVEDFDKAVQVMEKLSATVVNTAGAAADVATLCSGAKAHHRTVWAASAAATVGQSANFGGLTAIAAAKKARDLGVEVANAKKWTEVADRPLADFKPVEESNKLAHRRRHQAMLLRELTTEIKKREQWLTQKLSEEVNAKKDLPNVCPMCGNPVTK